MMMPTLASAARKPPIAQVFAAIAHVQRAGAWLSPIGFPAVNRTKMFHVKQFCPIGPANRAKRMRQTSRRGGMTK